MGVMTTQLYSQFQVGDDIIGKTDENSGWSVALAKNLNGQPQMLAVGGPSVTKGGIESGTVRVYKLVNNNWVQKGSELIGSNIDDQFGYSLSMPDINTLAIGIPGSDLKSVDCGEVKIYKWDGSDWIFNSSIFGSDSFDNFGFAISMPSKNVIAVSSPNNHGTGPEEKWTQMGQVKIFKLNQTAWEQIGNNLNGSNQGASLTTDKNGESGKAYSFNNSHISVAHSNLLNFTDSFSISLWVFSTNYITNDWQEFLMKGSVNNLYRQYHIRPNKDTGKLTFIFYQSGIPFALCALFLV